MKKQLLKKIKYGFKLIKLFFIYSKHISFLRTTSQKEIIIVFDGHFSHGGLVDRFKGIVSFYEFSKRNNYKFKIHFTHPFDLETFLIPNKVDWKASEKDMKWNPFSTKFLFLMDNFDFNFSKEVLQSNKKKMIVYANIDYLAKFYNNLSEEQVKQKWKNAFYDLFKESNYLEKALLEISRPVHYISIHTRFTSILGDFSDTTNHVITESRKNEIIKSIINEINSIQHENENNSILVFSDSILFLNYIKENTNYIVLAGEPSHVDVKNNSIMESNLKTFTDFLIMSKSQKIVLIRTPEMYNSAFSKYASFLSEATFECRTIK